MDVQNIPYQEFEKIGLTPAQKREMGKLRHLYRRTKSGHSESNTDPRTKQFVMFGLTGDGKSTFGNLLLKGRDYDKKHPIFVASGAAEVCTQNVEKERGHWLGNPYEEEFVIIDTPGMNDAECTNEERLASIITDLRKLGYMHAFIMVFNGATPRFSEAHKKMIAIYQGVFGIKLFTNMVIVFTRWGMSEGDKEKREDEDVTEELRSQQFNKHISEAFPEDFHAGTKSIPCFFLDSWDFVKMRPGYEEMEESLEKMWMHIRKLPAFHTINMKELNREVEDNAEKVKLLSPILQELKEDKRHAEMISKLEKEREVMMAELQKLKEAHVFTKIQNEELKKIEQSRQQQRTKEKQNNWFDLVKGILPKVVKYIFRMFKGDSSDDDDDSDDDY